MKNVCIISLGCPKNLVDTEILAGQFSLHGYNLVTKVEDSDFVFLTTCGFIKDARDETRRYISQLVKKKRKYGFKLYIVGCYVELERENLLKRYEDIDGIFGISEYETIPEIVSSRKKRIVCLSNKEYIYTNATLRIISTPNSYAYIKLADGCNNRCSYCLIPAIRGNYRERTVEDILTEAEKIVSNGIKELILISHDTTMYGLQLYKTQILHKLLKELAKIPYNFWIRLLYTHPGHFYPELFKEISVNEKVLKYIDIPIQHTSDKILKLMNRPPRQKILSTIEKLKKINNITLRTSVIVGFPQETEHDFFQLLNDIKEIEFDWLGCFEYSQEELTAAAKISPKVPKNVIQQRKKEVMLLQQKITYKKNLSRIGKKYKLFLDEKLKNSFVGHTEFQSPEIDGKTYVNFIKDNFTNPVEVEIKKVLNVYDLVSVPIDNDK